MIHRPIHVRRAASLRPLALAALTLCAFSSAHARNEEPVVLLAQNLRAPQLAETVVTATRTEQPLSDLVADVSIVDRETIEASGATGGRMRFELISSTERGFISSYNNASMCSVEGCTTDKEYQRSNV